MQTALLIGQGGNIGEGGDWGPFFLLVLGGATVVFVIAVATGLVLVRAGSPYPRRLGLAIAGAVPLGALASLGGGLLVLVTESGVVGIGSIVLVVVAYVWWFASRWKQPPAQ
ncbi:MAG: hypothetical protein KJO07_17405 [Deltaproteobacteria bacterium]|nr:hypothetical protein [Deltaproteobacteria bacterium]